MLNGTILNKALKIISCKMTGCTILNALYSWGDKILQF